MKRILLLLLASILSTIDCSSQTYKSDECIITTSSWDKTKFMDISDFAWSFKAGDDMQWAKPNFDDSKWESRRSYWFTDSLKTKDDFNGIGWSRLKFEVDDSLLNKVLYLQVCQPGACEVYLDGNFIGNLGKPSKDPEKESVFPTLFESKNVYQVVSNKIYLRLAILLPINSQKEHTLALRFSYHQYDRLSPWLRDDYNLKGFKIYLVKDDYFIPWYDEHSIFGYEYWNDFVIFICLTMGFLFLALYLFFNTDNLNLWIGIPFFLIGFQSLFISKIAYNLPNEYQYLLISYWTAILNVPQYLYMVILAYYLLFFHKFLPQTKYLTILVLLDVFLRLLNRFPTTYHYAWVSWYDEQYHYNYILTFIFLSELLRVAIVGTWRKKGAFIALIGTVFTYLLFVGGYLSLIILKNYNLTNNLWLLCVLSLAILSAISMAYRNSVVLKHLIKQLAKIEKLSSEKQLILENQNQELEHQVNERTIQLHETNEELIEANEIVQSKSAVFEEQNKEIKESISYAQNIQSAMLPMLNYIQEFIPEIFILFKPRDIVSGDFYYFSEKNGRLVIAAVDCTGHGVPGAFMSMIGNDILNNLVEVQGIIEADIILNELHKGIRQVLKQKESNNKDGMDISLLVIDQANGLVEYSGAKNSLFYIQNQIPCEASASKMSIGGEQLERDRIYFKHVIPISPVQEEKTIFYLFTDGYQDQFGGEQKRKFMARKMKDLMFQIHTYPMDQQKEILDQKVIEWMGIGSEKQIDDILIMGIRI